MAMTPLGQRHNAQPRFVPRGLRPTAEQLDIQLSQHKISLIHANAGAAKTTSLALRLAEALARGMSPRSILVLTFTPEAAEVMRQRVLELGVAASLVAQLHITHVEAWAHQVLRQLDEAVVPHAEVATLQQVMREAMARVSEQYGTTYDGLEIVSHAAALGELLLEQQKLKARMALHDEGADGDWEERAWTAGTTLTRLLVTHHYEQLRLGTLGSDPLFRGPGDAMYDLARYLLDDPIWQSRLPRYQLVLVDELHDMNEATFQVLAALVDSNQCYMMGAGDKDQVIYSELGADDSYLLHRFQSRYGYVRAHSLTQTFRHGPHLAFAVEHFKQKIVSSAVVHRTEIQRHRYHDDADGAVRCVQLLTQSVATYPWADTAVLLRGAHLSVPLEEALWKARIPYITHGFEPYLYRREILVLLGLVALALEDLARLPTAALRASVVDALVFFAELDYPADELAQAKQSLAAQPDALAYFWEGQLLRRMTDTRAAQFKHALSLVRQHLDHPAETALVALVEALDIAAVVTRQMANAAQGHMAAQTLHSFIACAHTSELDLIAYFQFCGQRLAEFNPSHQSAGVRLELIGSAKGKEYAHVVLPYLTNRQYPFNTDHFAEEENLFYVAVTRAKYKVSLLIPQHGVSPFVERLGLELTAKRADNALALLQRRQAADQAAHQQREVRRSKQAAPFTLEREDLAVPYAERNEAKGLGARWDAVQKCWYIPKGLGSGQAEQLRGRWPLK